MARTAGLGLTRGEVVLIGLALAAPTLGALAVLPTYHVNTIESINWGREFHLGTPKFPPLMTWLGGIADRLPFADGWGAIALQSAVTLAAVAYLIAIARLIMPAHRVRLTAVSLLLSVLAGVWSVAGFALNADLVQAPFWAGLVYHLIQARRRPEGVLHWVLAGAMLALAFLTKYFAAVLALPVLAAMLMVPEYRALWRRRGPWIALATAAVMVAPHAVWVLQNLQYVSYPVIAINLAAPLDQRLAAFWEFFSGLFFLAFPYVSVLSLAFWFSRGTLLLELRTGAGDPDRRFFANVLWLALGLIALLIFAGAAYKLRFDTAIVGFFIVQWMVMLPVEEDEADWLHRVAFRFAIGLWALVYAGMVVLYLNVTHRYAQEPADAAAAAIRAAWNERYACGPAYVVGERHPAQSIAVYYRRGVVGVPLEDRALAAWYDPARARAEGYVVVAWNEDYLFRLRQVLRIDADVWKLSLPLRRSFANRQESYWYSFVAPQGCPATPG